MIILHIDFVMHRFYFVSYITFWYNLGVSDTVARLLAITESDTIHAHPSTTHLTIHIQCMLTPYRVEVGKARTTMGLLCRK